MSKISSITELENWLETFLNFEKLPQKNIFWLDTMQYLCQRFGNPQRAIPSVHIAGSKGKGSVSIMISSILAAAGYPVGLYTSPHIMDFVERIGTAFGPFPVEVYNNTVRELIYGISQISDNELPAGRPITWFELVTLFAFLCFRRANVAWGIYEVGLGGRLDATNVLLPKICAITPIELEHTQYLGNTVEKIAREKAGIIKNSVPVIIASQIPSVRSVFIEVAQKHLAPLLFVEDLLTSYTFSYTKNIVCTQNNTKEARYGMKIHLESPVFSRPIDSRLKLLGEFQARNAALAAFVVKHLFPRIDEKIIEKGLSSAVLPGRFEILNAQENHFFVPALILDGAHTVNSVQYTLSTFNALFSSTQPAHLLFACAADKDVEHIAVLFRSRFEKITLTCPGAIKHANMERLKNAFTDAGLNFLIDDDYNRAIKNALSYAAKESVPLLVTGSFYLVTEVKRILATD